MCAHAGPRQTIPAWQRPHRINTRLEFTAIQQRLIDTDVSSSRHVLDTGNAETRRMIRGGAGGRQFFFEAGSGNYFPDETLRRVFQNSRGLAGFWIAHDDSARWVFRLTRD